MPESWKELMAGFVGGLICALAMVGLMTLVRALVP